MAEAGTGAVLGTGNFSYRVAEDWARLPAGWVLGDVAAVAVAPDDAVFVFNRGPHPMMIFSREGVFRGSWGEGLFVNPHGLHLAPDGALYCTDDGDHTVRKCTLDGEVLLEIGIPNRPSPAMSGRPFHRCTHTALSPAGDIYVTDGYGNACVHVFDRAGRFQRSWGEPGCDPGQFNLPHNIHCDEHGLVYVADRENHRIQVFDGAGAYRTQWNNLHRPSALFMTGGQCPLCFVGEIGPYMAVNRDTPNLGPRVSILSGGDVLARLGNVPSGGIGPGQFLSPHGIAVDSHGDIYVAEVGRTAWPSLFPGVPTPSVLPTLKKLIKQPA